MKTAVILAVILGVAVAQQQKARNYQPSPPFNYNQQGQASSNRNSYDQDRGSYQSDSGNYDDQGNQRQASGSLTSRTGSTTPIPILSWNKQQEHDGTYKASYETGNNIQAEESGYIKTIGQGEDQTEALVQQGSYTFMTPDGQIITTHYTADETGFHVQGDHIPTPPPVSEEIQKGLDLIYAGIRQQEEEAAREAQLSPAAQKAAFDRRVEEDSGRYRP